MLFSHPYKVCLWNLLLNRKKKTLSQLTWKWSCIRNQNIWVSLGRAKPLWAFGHKHLGSSYGLYRVKSNAGIIDCFSRRDRVILTDTYNFLMPDGSPLFLFAFEPLLSCLSASLECPSSRLGLKLQLLTNIMLCFFTGLGKALGSISKRVRLVQRY